MSAEPSATRSRTFRSLLFTPASEPRRVARVFTAGADVAILDLEDSVPRAHKAPARLAAVAALARPRTGAAYVRVNGFDSGWCLADLEAVIGPGLDGVMVPKSESAEVLRAIDWVMGELERARGLAAGAIDLLPLVESARGIESVEALAGATARVRRLAFGGGDYTQDVGIEWTEGEAEFGYARARLVHGSRAAGREPPIDTVLLQVRDAARFQTSARQARALGFQGKLCIHPDQVPIANAAFAPSEAEVAAAQEIIAAFTAALATGSAALEVGGVFVDYAVVAKARRTLAAAGIEPPVTG